MSANKLSILKTLIILGCFAWILPAQADEATSTIDIVSSTPEITTSTIELTTTTLEITTSTAESATTTPEIDTTSTTPSAETNTSTPDISTNSTTIESATTTPETNTSSTEQVHTNRGGSNTQTQLIIDSNQINNAVQKILNFLKSKQLETGSIIDLQTSDWSAMSFGANNTYANEIKNPTVSLYDYLNNTLITSDTGTLNNCTEYPRHILGLLASGAAKTNNQIIDLKNKIKTECLTNNQVGQVGINDDIFILLALLATDENSNSEIIQTSINTIKADQQTDGSFTWNGWSGQDVTGAAINALKYASTFGIAIDNSIFDKAKNYLRSTQLNDGGWGFGASDPLTTAWAIYGLNSLGEGQSQWANSQGKNPWTVLTSQLDGGYYTSPWSTDGIDWFATKHAVPALLGKSWPIILTPLATTQNTPNSASSGGSNTPSTSTPTPSIITPTSTPTTTPIIVIVETSTPDQATTTGEVLGEKITREEEIIKLIISKPKKLIPKNTLPVVKSELAQTTQIEPEKITPAVLPEIKQPDDSNRNTVKIILAVSGGGILIIGIYLGLKTLKK